MNKNESQIEDTKLKVVLPGLPMLFLFIILAAAFVYFTLMGFLTGKIILTSILSSVFLILYFIFIFGLKMLKPNSAYILTLFGKYVGTLKGPGFYYINPLMTKTVVGTKKQNKTSQNGTVTTVDVPNRTLSLKAITLNNQKQKINDLNGNPIEIGIVVIWKVVDCAKAVFNVENYSEFISIQSDSALRSIVRNYPYDCAEEDDQNKLTLRGDSKEIADNLKSEIQNKVAFAGIEVIEAKITHLAYAQEIAAAMLQRQQASAIIDARKMIVDGAVSMVKMALEQLKEEDILELDEERKAAMVSNLLVVLCGNKDAQPIVNSGSLY